jgi:methoxymalonate biosynthesis acyl carrier protein
MKPQPRESNPNGNGSDNDASSPLCGWLIGLFSEKLHIEVPSLDTDLMETGALDSLTLVELLLCLEQGLGIKIALEDLDLDNFRSIARIAEFIGQRNGHRNGSSNQA